MDNNNLEFRKKLFNKFIHIHPSPPPPTLPAPSLNFSETSDTLFILTLFICLTHLLQKFLIHPICFDLPLPHLLYLAADSKW